MSELTADQARVILTAVGLPSTAKAHKHRRDRGPSAAFAFLTGQSRDEQRGRNSLPLGIERIARDVLACALVPVRGVPQVAFFPVQVRMHPRATGIVDILSDRMCTVPVA